MAKNKAKTNNGKKRVCFEVEAEAGSKVYLVGGFNAWDVGKKELVDKDGCGVYKCIVMLTPGTHEYKFVINDEWYLDPCNTKFVTNDHGTLNSLLEV